MTDTQLTFQPIDAMDVRHKFGEVGNLVKQKRRRFVVQVRGKDTFLIVPLSDKQVIGSQAQAEERDRAYLAFERLEGLVTEPVTDASQTVDLWSMMQRKSQENMSDNSVLIDSDVFMGLVFREDAHHQRVKDLCGATCVNSKCNSSLPIW